MKRAMIILAGVLALGACDDIHIDKKIHIGEEKAVEPLKPGGPPATLAADTDANLQWSAGVVKLDELQDQDSQTVKVFGTAGGDPAMNGLYTYVAFFVSPAEGWAVFKVGDFLDYKVLDEAPGHVDLEIEESVMDQASGQIGSRKRKLIVGWVAGADGAAPASVTVTAAQ